MLLFGANIGKVFELSVKKLRKLIYKNNHSHEWLLNYGLETGNQKGLSSLTRNPLDAANISYKYIFTKYLN